ncbi:MAG TPA: membrane dipeptidase [Thermomicrobiales bacterium]|nr:membrane dipeptidase [Thermomicrobiales bacterium]
MLAIDAHLDLAMNAVLWDRDLKLSAHETRQIERSEGMTEKGRCAGTVGIPDLRAGEFGLVFATVLARTNQGLNSGIDFRTQDNSYAQAQGQLALYREFERQGIMRMIRTAADLTQWKSEWDANPATTPIGYVLLMEGGDPIVEPEQARGWFDDGLRMVGLAHYGPSQYAYGTASAGPITPRGKELLKVMDEVGMIQDMSHLTDQSFYEALDLFQGPIFASHSNCRALVPGDRQISDDMIKRMVERDAVIGAVFDAWMLQPNWERGVTTNENVTIATVVDHIDHVCQIAGNADHAAIGTDLDGGYGIEQTPKDLDTIVDVQNVADILRNRGYAEADVAKIMHGNWLRFLERALPAN